MKSGRKRNSIYDINAEDKLTTYGIYSQIYYDKDELIGKDTLDVLAVDGDPVAFDIRVSQEERINKGREPFNEEDISNYDIVQSDFGKIIINNEDSLTSGVGGSVSMNDSHLRSKLMHFDHENIPERVVHARGSGAYGTFTCTKSLKDITKLAPFQDAGKETDIFVRFSQVVGFRGSPDPVRDARGFAIKFYTEDGNWDLVGNAQPVFFINDAIKFPDLVHAAKPEPNNLMPQATGAHDNFWDFISQTPESVHMITWVMSDSGVPRSYRTMEGYGVHSFKFPNYFVKFLWKPEVGMQSISNSMVSELKGVDTDYLRRDLWEAIERRFFPNYIFYIQLMKIDDADNYPFDPLDATKIWPIELFPLIECGRFELNRNPDNFFSEVEQSAFHPGHLTKGIEASNDPLLQGRLFSYLDTQINRFNSVNFNDLPVNRPIIEVENNEQDGYMNYNIKKGQINYSPNTRKGGDNKPIKCPYSNKEFNLDTNQLTYKKSDKFNDHYSQATARYMALSKEQRIHMIEALHNELGHVKSIDVRRRMIKFLHKIHPHLAKNVKNLLIL